jgi:hypothetical protein
MNPIKLFRGTHEPPGFRARLPRTARAWIVALPLMAACADRPVTLPAPQAPPAQPAFMALTLTELWTGSVSSDWGTAGNWQSGMVPTSASGVDVPDDALLPSHVMPVLGADAAVTDLRVGVASTLGLGGNTLNAAGNVDVLGSITNGTLWMSGTGALLAGSVNKLKVDGRVSLERRVVTTGRVTVTGAGSLSVADSLLSIQIP